MPTFNHSDKPVAGKQKVAALSKVLERSDVQQSMLSAFGSQKHVEQVKSSLLVLASKTPELKKCEPLSLITAASMGEDLKLPMSATLGYYYILPFKEKIRDELGKIVYKSNPDGSKATDKNGRWIPETISKATFVLGYKGYWQLAMRSGLYKRIIVLPIKESEFLGYNMLTEEIQVSMESDIRKRNEQKTVGYYAMFELVSGFRKAIYWPHEQMMYHADTYSPAFSASIYQQIQNGEIPDKDMWKYSSFWYKDFDGMATKTMIRHLLSRYGALSPEMQTAISNDNVIAEYEPELSVPEFDDFPEEETSLDTGVDEEQMQLPTESATPSSVRLSDL